MHAESDCCHGGNREQVGVSEDNPQPDPAHREPNVHGIAHMAVEAYNHQALRRRDRRRSPVSRPAKSQTQRTATANPKTDGRAASQRQWAPPAISKRNPSHCGRSQNHNEKNAVPTASAASAMGQCCSCELIGTFPEFGFVIIPPICTYELATLLSPQLDCRIRSGTSKPGNRRSARKERRPRERCSGSGPLRNR